MKKTMKTLMVVGLMLDLIQTEIVEVINVAKIAKIIKLNTEFSWQLPTEKYSIPPQHDGRSFVDIKMKC